jgi:hypothetical protein
LHEDIHAKTRRAGQTVRDIAGTLFSERSEGVLVIADKIGGNLPRIVAVRARGPVALRRPLTSIIGGFPGEKNKSLILVEARSIAIRSAGVENADGAAATAAAVAVPGPTVGEEDIEQDSEICP